MADEIISRAEARAKGLKWYFTGKSCINGHTEPKLVSSGRCKICSALHAKDWVNRNPVRVKKYMDDWRSKNQNIIKAACRDWQRRHKFQETERRRSQAELLRKKSAEYARKNPEKARLYSRNRRALKKTTGTHTLEEISCLLRKQGFRCASCFISIKGSGRNIRHADHIVPISSGGTNDIGNIQMLCQPCNSRKYNKDPFEWGLTKTEDCFELRPAQVAGFSLMCSLTRECQSY